MGIEYKIQFAHSGAESIAAVLRRLPMVQEVSADERTFAFRADQTDSTMPDAMASVEPDGLYFCDNGGAGKQFLGLVIARLVSKFGPIAIAEWE